MDPRHLLQALCRRHGLDPEAGGHLIGLVVRALQENERQRRLLLEMVDRALARLAAEVASGQGGDGDGRLLGFVARALHGWKAGERTDRAG